MKRTGHRLVASFSRLLLVLLIAVPVGMTWRQVRQERLNRALIEAIKARHDQDAITMLEHGADARARDVPSNVAADRRTPWRVLLDLVMGRRIHQAGGPSALLLAMGEPGLDMPPEYSPSLHLVRFLLKDGANPNDADTQGLTPLMLASVLNRPDLIQLMIAHGANPEVRDDTCSLVSAFLDREPGTHDIMFPIYQAGSGNGPSLLMCTIEWGSTECVKALVEAHANVNAVDATGDSALAVAVRFGKVESVALLLAHGADFTRRDPYRATPLVEAESGGGDPDHRVIIRLLKAAGARK